MGHIITKLMENDSDRALRYGYNRWYNKCVTCTETIKPCEYMVCLPCCWAYVHPSCLVIKPSDMYCCPVCHSTNKIGKYSHNYIRSDEKSKDIRSKVQDAYRSGQYIYRPGQYIYARSNDIVID